MKDLNEIEFAEVHIKDADGWRTEYAIALYRTPVGFVYLFPEVIGGIPGSFNGRELVGELVDYTGGFKLEGDGIMAWVVERELPGEYREKENAKALSELRRSLAVASDQV